MIVNKPVDATYYSLIGATDCVILVARWMNDYPSGSACWIELDREPHKEGEYAHLAWDRIRERNSHLLPTKGA